MIFDVLTLFPEMFDVFNYSMIGRAKEKGLLTIDVHNIREYTTNKHKKVDDYPYGGGAGMVMQAEPVYNAVEKVISIRGSKPYTVLMSPRGKKYDQSTAKRLVDINNIMFICGHYEGLDERIMPLIDEELSLGDFVLTGGELACMAMIDSTARLLPGVLSTAESFEEESFYDGVLEYPHYTRPEEFRGMRVPEILLSGHHANIKSWRRFKSLELTRERRPDLFEKLTLSKQDKKILEKFKDK
jgi:tRNA (guanine37-N1)-methyltransferase